MPQSDTRKWITVYPDYIGIFAWLRDAIGEDKLDNGVGELFGLTCPSCGEVIFDDKRPVPSELAVRICNWSERWCDADEQVRGSHWDDELAAECNAIEEEGIEITKQLKKLYGDRYRFRYSYAWKSEGKNWIAV